MPLVNPCLYLYTFSAVDRAPAAVNRGSHLEIRIERCLPMNFLIQGATS